MKKILIAALVLAVAACGKKVQTVSEIETVDWYVANQDVMNKVLAECGNNPGELAADQNCINADTASTQVLLRQKGAGKVREMRQDFHQ